MIAMIDMGLGNLASVALAFNRAGANVGITSNPAEMEKATAIVLPGVGAFGDGMRSLTENGLAEPLKRQAARNVPILGICLGMQLFAESGEEHGLHEGLGIVPGRVMSLEPGPADRVPHIGWSDVTVSRSGKLFPDERPRIFYFAHSFHFECAHPSDAVAHHEFGGKKIVAAIERGNIFGVQFHPEKSQDAGMEIIESFLRVAS